MSGRRTVGLWAVLLLAAPAAAADEPDPDVVPAQFNQPAGPPTAMPSAPTVADPPTPVVRVQVRVPAHVAPGKDIPYKLIVTNPSPADAYKVRVRNPLPAGTAGVVKIEPAADNYDPRKPAAVLPAELVWDLHTLKAGERREIELTLRPTGETKEIASKAFVSFEHGQAVLTRIDRPKLSVRKAAPEKAAVGDRIPVRVEVTNTGRVPLAGVELVENVTKGFSFAADADGERTNDPNQRLWKLGTLAPGQRKLVEYTLTAKESADLLASSKVRSLDTPEAESADSTTKVLAAAMALDFTGPATATGGEPGAYTVKVTNTGTLSLADVRVTVTVPEECTLTGVTAGYRKTRDQISWDLPLDRANGPLRPGQAADIRFKLKSTTSGKRTVRAIAEGPRGLEKSAEVKTEFQGAAVLSYSAKPEPAVLTAGGANGLVTIVVKNQGGEPARNVRLRVMVPSQVRLEQASPRNENAGSEVVFAPVTIPPNGNEKFTLTIQPARAGQAWFDLKLEAEALGDQPLTKRIAVEVANR